MKFRFLAIFLCGQAALPLFSQFSTDFSDGNLDLWEGDKVNFVINGHQQLQLNAPAGSTASWIYTPVVFGDSMEWEMYIKLDFAPSTSNQLKIFLGVNNADLASASGYFLEIGASGNADPIELKYLNNGSSESLAVSTPGIAGTEPVELTLRLTKKSDGTWLCYILNDVTPELLFSTSHDLMPLHDLSFFGLYCKYSDTRRDKFFFDDISIQPIQPLQPDTTAPRCTLLNVKDSNTLELVFDEPLDETTVQVPGHYMLTPGNVSPDDIETNQSNILLRWNDSFESQQEYTLTIHHVKDLAGNEMLPDQKTFTYVEVAKAMPFELLITEIMADPTPVIGLPDAEYLEIFNASPRIFSLSAYSLQVNSSIIQLPDELIYSQEYVIICDEDKAALFLGKGRIIALSNFPSLTNGGATIALKNNEGLIIHDVSYSSSWYGDPGKSDGGWSLEMINPLNICLEMENWSAAENLIGGTPGIVNSSWSARLDEVGPVLLSLYTSANDKIVLHFDERLDPLLMENPAAYSIFPALEISSAKIQDAKAIELTLADSLKPGIVYQLLPFEGFDCLGNSGPSGDTIFFGLTAYPEEGDILINEILFNPASGGSRFIEIKNASQKFIDLGILAIGRLKGGQHDIFPTGISEIIGPGRIVVLTPEPADLLSRYTVPHPAKLFEAPLPSWDAQTDNVAIMAGGEVIDSLTYFSTWHLPVIADQNGVSLERISATSPSISSSTWHSASSASGYATPTGENSQNLNAVLETETPFTVANKQFSPNEDGYKDFLALNFLLASGEDLGSVWIYDLEGREINRLISNESLGTSTIVQWDGRNADQLLADMGIYIIFVQLWDAKGNVREYQETCALVKR